ncbi:hypothetical protein HONESTABE_115 [Bacillus phage HonestAbe]|uniref:hypothetical protein n=1 Tax=Bacillus phage Zuko TaxID=1805956 RepID=UPI0007A76BBA|nr:hypothetical protein BI001_gp260 [Bacillus phage Zuko]AMW62343.1 hypothetical protein ZUKO_118 [Bacillus phage Zuko]AUV57752.1 hypothetical protein HONESTABE_115 [Bacillus phage HonestAbe]AXF42049.1 hypothetical protein [Bacillus phage Saddex]
MSEYRAASGALVFVPTAEMERQMEQQNQDLRNSIKLKQDLEDVAKMKAELEALLKKAKESTT